MGSFGVVIATLSLLSSFISAFPTSTSTPALPLVAGCGKTQIVTGVDLLRTLPNNDRTYWYHLPAGYNKNQAYPVVLGFHGSSKIGMSLDGLSFRADTRLSSTQFTSSKIVVYPNGIGGVWAGPSYGTVSVAEDLAYVEAVLRDLNSTLCVDTDRIYATGFSNGAGFLNSIACSSTSEYFAAFAPVSGSFYTDNSETSVCTPARLPVPILEFHGGNDKTVNYSGGQGEGGIEPSIPDWLNRWAARNKCLPQNPTVDSFDGDVHWDTWNCAGKTNLLQHYKTDDMGHAWPSTEINLSGLSVPEGPTHLEASSMIVQFFDRFTRYG